MLCNALQLTFIFATIISSRQPALFSLCKRKGSALMSNQWFTSSIYGNIWLFSSFCDNGHYIPINDQYTIQANKYNKPIENSIVCNR